MVMIQRQAPRESISSLVFLWLLLVSRFRP
jgi:hypothetical protein